MTNRLLKQNGRTIVQILLFVNYVEYYPDYYDRSKSVVGYRPINFKLNTYM